MPKHPIIEWRNAKWKVSALKDHPHNPRQFTEKGMADLRDSIRNCGYVEPIAINTTGTILSGHARKKILMEAGLKEVDVRVPDRELTEKEEREVLLRMNKNTAGEFNFEILANEFEIEELKEVGFTDADLKIGGYDFGEPQEEKPIPEFGKCEPIVKRGDVFMLGAHCLVCGDSTTADDVNACLNGATPILMVTDPPYGVEYNPQWRQDAADKGLINPGATATGQVENDGRVDWSEAYSLFNGSVAYVWHAGKYAAEVARNIEDCGFQIVSQIIWAKPAFAISRGDYHWQHEPCWYAVKKGSTHNWQGSRKDSTLWQIANGSFQGRTEMGEEENKRTGHGTQKPIECMERPIRNNTSVGQGVYDPFLGSGTTLIACERTGRIGYGLEISPAYCEVIIRRYFENYPSRPFKHMNGDLSLDAIREGNHSPTLAR